MTSDGKPYGPYRFKEIVKQCYIISTKCNTSYTDLLEITPRERDYLFEFIMDEVRETEELTKKKLQESGLR
ncbi:MAG: hypothetical protein IJH65_03300 [Methanobrevibacter sp.]|nr:hypothetical protein [Methanobrevibacter sp.]